MLLRALILFLCFLPPALRAQQGKVLLQGAVQDREGKRLEGVLVKWAAGNKTALSDEFGLFTLQLPVDSTVKLEGFVEKKRVFSEEIRLSAPKDSTQPLRIFIAYGRSDELDPVRIVSGESGGTGTVLKPRSVEAMTGLGSGIENIIKTLPGVFSNNELSSQYSVRGGNFDENLVYVNDVEIYRPQLIHSGQQEGLSFINPQLVKKLTFNAGGFEARYGDKQSSVLDVEYRNPTRFESSLDIGLLGASAAVEGISKNRRLSGIAGVRWRSNTLVLNTLDVAGRYVTNFYDAQWLLAYRITPRLRLEWLGNFAENRYRLNPQSRETSFGTAQNAFNLFVAMGGQEFSGYTYGMSALTLHFKPGNRKDFKLIVSGFSTREREVFDIFGAYSLGLLDKDPGSATYGRPIRNLGAGYFIDHGRNRLNSGVFSVSHIGSIQTPGRGLRLHWGLRAQQENITDRLHEWLYNDSADYNVPPFGFGRDSVVMDGFVSSRSSLSSLRLSGHVQTEIRLHRESSTRLTMGIRSQHWTLNGQTIFSPRLQLVMEPNRNWNLTHADSLQKPNIRYYLAGGVYQQPAFYRELRGFDGQLNTALKAQRSYHTIAGIDRTIELWGRRFKWLGEAYYKYMDRQVPYLFDNIRIRYYAENSSQAYAWGVDNRINGEFIPGLESWFTLSVLQTKENIRYMENGLMKESGFIRRPTDKRVNAAIVFQDQLPGNERYRMNLNLIFGSGMPYYLSGRLRYREVYNIPAYRRVDIGFSKTIVDAKYRPPGKVWDKVESCWVSLEIFNMLGIDNVISYLWVKDFSANIYGVPEFLTGRMLNLRLNVRIK